MMAERADTNVTQNNIERVEKEQYAPGVYIYFKCLAGGAKNIIKVRFRGRMFSKIQADSWWAENRARVYQHYNVPLPDQSTSDIGSGSEDMKRKMRLKQQQHHGCCQIL